MTNRTTQKATFCAGVMQRCLPVVTSLFLAWTLVSALLFVAHMLDDAHAISDTGHIVHVSHEQALSAVPHHGLYEAHDHSINDHLCAAATIAMMSSPFDIVVTLTNVTPLRTVVSQDVQVKALETVYLSHRLHHIAPKQSPPQA
ncbi:MAG: hypothetical protein FWC40_08080 [Proteobacteria bacterium]|nr:hypothetical protein [Pseudomonadota bacterium]